MARMEQIKWSDSSRQIHASKESWQEFVDALYEANPDVLPPKHMVTSIECHITPGDLPTFVFDIIGLKIPVVPDPSVRPVIGENGVPD